MQLNPTLLSAYADRLQGFKPTTLAKTFAEAEKRCKFFPSVAELREFAKQIVEYGEILDEEDTDAEVRYAQKIRNTQ